VELTAQLFAQGLNPAQMAAQRGLTERTVYGHLAQLIGLDRIPLSAIVPDHIALRVQRAIEDVGDVSPLSALKARLPDDISYEHIRCVVADWNRRHGEAQAPSPNLSGAERARRVAELGDLGSPAGVPELVAALEDSDGNVRRLAASALRKIPDERAFEPLVALLAQEGKPQVRQYAVKALGALGDRRASSLLAEIANDDTERGYVRSSAREALGTLTRRPTQEHSITQFLSQSRPRQLPGTWDLGWALGDNSRFAGAEWSRSPVGDLTYRLKYQGDLSTIPSLIDHILSLFADQPEFARVDVVVPVPPTLSRSVDPVSALAEALAARIARPLWSSALVKTRLTAPQKDMHTLAQKRANVAGAFAVRGHVRDKRLLVLDDLFDSGATLDEISKVLRGAGAARLHVLTLTRTIHTAA
jgi:competence protein ComFC